MVSAAECLHTKTRRGVIKVGDDMVSGCDNRDKTKGGLGFFPCFDCLMEYGSQECNDYLAEMDRIQTKMRWVR